MKDTQMRGLIFDVNVLIYIHDLLSIINHDPNFIDTKTYRQLFESTLKTTLKYIQKIFYVLLSFIVVVLLMKTFQVDTLEYKYFVYAFISVFYGFCIMACKEDIVSLKYQLRAKKAVQFAIMNYSYDQFVLFLDQYLSEESTRNYIKKSI